jgi:hypothetical protein
MIPYQDQDEMLPPGVDEITRLKYSHQAINPYSYVARILFLLGEKGDHCYERCNSTWLVDQAA